MRDCGEPLFLRGLAEKIYGLSATRVMARLIRFCEIGLDELFEQRGPGDGGKRKKPHFR